MSISFKNIINIAFTFFLLVSCNTTRKASKKKDNKNNAEMLTSKEIQEKYAKLLDVSPQAISNKPLYELIDDWYGTKYQYAGKSKDGIDCSAFVSVIFKNIYKKELSGSSANIFNQCVKVDTAHLKQGDLVFFKIDGDKISHVGVYLDNKRFVHASTKAGVRIDSLEQEYYKKIFYSGGRIK